jgi:hypothetical protein
MSYCTETGDINALLMGPSLEQAEYIRETISGHKDIIKSARSILQLVTAWEYLSKSLLLEIDALNKFVDSLAAATNDNRVKMCSEIIIERLRFISLKGNEVLFVAQKVKDRVSMQLAAFSNVLALHNNETSLNIATSTKIDSAAMSSIALLTMAFLLSTFLAVS